MTEQVIYELGLRDKMSAGVQGATGHVNALERSLGSVKGLLTGIGVGLAAFKLVEFAHQANEEWEKMEFAMSQVQAGLKSTGGAAGLTFEELKTGAQDAAHNLKFTQAEILGMQSILLTFPAVTKDVFGEASAVIEDMSTRLGTDLKGSAIQVGKALQDPVRGMTALRKAGVNFSIDQQNVIKNLVATNRAAEAQVMIINELKTEFGGSALAAAEADKSFRLDKTMEENRVALGEMIDKIKEDLMPVLLAVANGFKNLIEFVQKYGKELKNLTIALASAWAAFKVLTAAPAIFLAIENAVVAAAVGTGGFGAAITAALGPVALLAAAIGGLIYVYNDWVDTQAEHADQAALFENNIIKQEQESLNTTVKNLEKSGMARKDAIARAKELEIANIKSTQQTIEGKIANESDPDKKKYLLDQRELLFKQQAAVESFSGLIPAKKSGTGAATATSTKPLAAEKTKAVGSKSVTINVTIQKLGETIINTTNIKEGAKELHDRVVKALTGAVNDFQVIANNS